MVQVVLDGWRLVTDEAGSERFRHLPTDRGHALSACGVSRRARALDGAFFSALLLQRDKRRNLKPPITALRDFAPA